MSYTDITYLVSLDQGHWVSVQHLSHEDINKVILDPSYGAEDEYEAILLEVLKDHLLHPELRCDHI